MKRLLFKSLLVVCLMSACAKGGNRNAQGAPAAGQTAPATGPALREEGSSSGGGSFGDESSLAILRWAAEDLAREISNSSPELYKDLPQGWSRERLAQMIRDVEPTSKTRETYKVPEVSRHGQRLMFDYRRREDGSLYITATRLFMDAYSHYEVNRRPKHEFGLTLEEVKLKLVHEVAHHLGLGLSKETDMPEARRFAKSVLEALDSDNVECLPTNAPPKSVYSPLEISSLGEAGAAGTPGDEFFANKTRAYLFNRPSGRAAVPSNVGKSCKIPDGKQGVTISLCSPLTGEADTAEGINVFAPKNYDASFDLKNVKKSVLEGQRGYGFKEGYFSWALIDLRKAVLTEEGFKSDFKYERAALTNSTFYSYMDFFPTKSDATTLELESFPPLKQENWDFYRSQGRSKIQVRFQDGKVAEAKLIVVNDYNLWLDRDKPAAEINVEVPLTCVRSFKPIQMR